MKRLLMILLLFSSSAFSQALPDLSDINPKSAVLGATITVTLTGTNFVTGSTSVVVTGSGVMPLSVRVTSTTSASTTLAVYGIPGKYALRVATAAGTSASSQTLAVTPGAVTSASQFDVSSLAGPDGGAGSLDGTGNGARFSRPTGIWVSNNIAYISDFYNNAIRKVTLPGGQVTTIAGTPGYAGSIDGAGNAAEFFGPAAVWGDSTSLFICDLYNAEIRKLDLASGQVTTIAGSSKAAPAQVDGIGTKARFVGPTGIWGDGTNLYIADSLSTTTRAIRKLILATGEVTTIADLGAPANGNNSASGVPTSNSVGYNVGLWGDGTALFIADSGRHIIRRLDLVSNTMTTYAGTDSVSGSADGAPTAKALFNYPSAIWGSSGTLFVADTGNNIVRQIQPSTITAGVALSVFTIAGSSSASGSKDGTGTNATLSFPGGLAGSSQTLYVTELLNNDLRMINVTSGAVTTIAGMAAPAGFADGSGNTARFFTPWGLCGDATNAYIADFYNLDVRRLDLTTTAVSTIAGSPFAGGSVDGSGVSQARFGFTTGAWCDGSNIFITDSYFDTIRQIALPGNFVSTVAGNPRMNSGYQDGIGISALFFTPIGIWGDGKNLYVADSINTVIRKIVVSTGAVSTLAGSPQNAGSSDGIGPGARFSRPTAIWGDGTNLYVTDGNGIRKVVIASGEVTTFIGSTNQAGSTDGRLLAARFFTPLGLWGDGTSLFVADSGNGLIRKVDLQTGTVITVAGLIPGSENGRGSAGRLNFPIGIWGDGSSLYVVDSGNNRIRKLVPVIPPDPSTVTNPGDIPYQITDRGGLSRTSSGVAATQVGYARILPTGGSTTPSGMAIFGFRQSGTLVSEAAVPASPLIQSGRIYAEISGSVNTGLAIANPNNQPAAISFFYTDSTGKDQLAGTTTIPANGQVAAFLDQPPFLQAGSATPTVLSSMRTFTFSSNFPIGVVALRGLTNERSEFLITTLPVISLDQPVTSTAPVTFPHFADGGGWKTRVILVNPSDTTLTGSLQFYSQGSSSPGTPISLTANGATSDTFAYSIPARSSYKLETAATGTSVQVGSVRVTPGSGSIAPSGLLVFSYTSGTVTVSEAGVAALPSSSAFRLYAEASGDFSSGAIGSIQTGFAISNPSTSPVTVNFELTTLDGASTGMTGTASVPGSGQIAMFLNQIQGLQNLPTPFQGVLRITGTTVNVTGLRGRYNERGDFLITTTPPINESAAPVKTELILPHLVDGGGYTTQFVLFSGSAGAASNGVLRFFSQSGGVLSLGLQ